MRPAEKALVHQAHPVKIGMDVTASVISNALLWRGRPKAARRCGRCCQWHLEFPRNGT